MNTQKDLGRVAIAVALILLIPVFGNLFVTGWNWGEFDFIVMGTLLFCTGCAIMFAIRKIANPIHRIITVVLIVLAFLAVWTELAVDAVSRLVGSLLS